MAKTARVATKTPAPTYPVASAASDSSGGAQGAPGWDIASTATHEDAANAAKRVGATARDRTARYGLLGVS